jgi:hypothetical protein
MAEAKTVRSVTGRQTTAGAAEETVLISLDGSAPAASISLGVGTSLTVTDWVATATAAANFRFQQTNNGSTWFDLFMLRLAADGTVGVSNMGVGIVVNGGANVAIRVRAETPAGAAAVTTSLRAYTSP